MLPQFLYIDEFDGISNRKTLIIKKEEIPK
jgi:hypothetical protein